MGHFQFDSPQESGFCNTNQANQDIFQILQDGVFNGGSNQYIDNGNCGQNRNRSHFTSDRQRQLEQYRDSINGRNSSCNRQGDRHYGQFQNDPNIGYIQGLIRTGQADPDVMRQYLTSIGQIPNRNTSRNIRSGYSPTIHNYDNGVGRSRNAHLLRDSQRGGRHQHEVYQPGDYYSHNSRRSRNNDYDFGDFMKDQALSMLLGNRFDRQPSWQQQQWQREQWQREQWQREQWQREQWQREQWRRNPWQQDQRFFPQARNQNLDLGDFLKYTALQAVLGDRFVPSYNRFQPQTFNPWQSSNSRFIPSYYPGQEYDYRPQNRHWPSHNSGCSNRFNSRNYNYGRNQWGRSNNIGNTLAQVGIGMLLSHVSRRINIGGNRGRSFRRW